MVLERLKIRRPTSTIAGWKRQGGSGGVFRTARHTAKSFDNNQKFFELHNISSHIPLSSDQSYKSKSFSDRHKVFSAQCCGNQKPGTTIPTLLRDNQSTTPHFEHHTSKLFENTTRHLGNNISRCLQPQPNGQKLLRLPHRARCNRTHSL
jgi:hypothetical protein